MSSFAIGVDLGGTNLRIAAVSDAGKLLERVETGTKVARGRDFVINEMCDAINALAAKFASTGKFAGAGIGVPGIIDKRTGMLRESPNLPGWHDYPVRDELERRLSVPVFLENDANAAAFGENWLGAARDFDEVCMVTLGTGVGGGIVIRQRLWHGVNGMAGELGHITIDPEGPRCNCGNYGCVEQYASATGILRMAREAIASGNAPELARAAAAADTEFSAKVVYNLAVHGDRPAEKIFIRVGWALGILLADLVNIFNFYMYVIGGGVSAAWDMFAPAMFDQLKRRSMVYAATAPEETIGERTGAAANVTPSSAPPLKRTLVRRALLGSDAGLYGAARLPLLGVEISSFQEAGARKRE